MKEEKIIMENKLLWQGDFIALYSDRSIGVSDGVGYVGEENDLMGLYEALQKLYEKPEQKQ